MTDTQIVPPVDDDDEELDDLVTDDKNPQVAALKREAIRRRKKVGLLKTENADLKAKLAAATTPKDGVVTLEGDEAKGYAAFKALGLGPDAIATGLRERDELVASQRITTAASAVGWRPGVLGTLMRAERFVVEMREVDVEGKKAMVPHVVTGEGEAAKAEPLTAYVEAKHPDFLAALKAETAEPGKTVTKVVTAYPSQAADGGTKKGLTREEEAARRRARGEGPTL